MDKPEILSSQIVETCVSPRIIKTVDGEEFHPDKVSIVNVVMVREIPYSGDEKLTEHRIHITDTFRRDLPA